MRHGFFLVDKPAGISSANVVARVKRLLSGAKVGHAGTLDPMATGLLVVLFGSCTRLADRVQAGEKGYEGVIRFGTVTNSDDITGDVIATSTTPPDFQTILTKSRGLIGVIEQIPPKISAVKVDGKRSYRLARSGVEVALEPRKVEVKELDLHRLNDFEVTYRVRCSKGTYVRSLARDLGEMVGCGGCLSSIRRTRSGLFSVGDAVTLDKITSADAHAWHELFPNTPFQLISAEILSRLEHGDPRAAAEVQAKEGDLILYGTEPGMPLGYVEKQSDQWIRGPLFG